MRVLWELFRLTHLAERVAGIPRGTGGPCCSFHPSGSTERVALTWLLGTCVGFGSTWPIHTMCSRKNRQRYPPHTHSLMTLRRDKPPINHIHLPQPDLIPSDRFPWGSGEHEGRKATKVLDGRASPFQTHRARRLF